MSLEQSPIIRRGRMDSVALLQNLVKIPSHASEEQIAGYISQVTTEYLPGFNARKLETTVAGRPALLVGNHPQPDVVFIAHYDTVEPWIQGADEIGKGKFDPFGAEINEGRLFGVGAGDDKSGVATAIAAVHSLLGGSESLPRVMMVFTSMEERSMQGMIAASQYFEEQIKQNPGYFPQFGLSLNGADKQLGTGCRGALEIEAEIKGLTGHAAIRTPGMTLPINAITGGVRVATLVQDQLMALEPTALGHVTMNLADIEGGLLNAEGGITKGVANKVPDIARMLLEFRLNDGEIDGELIGYDSLVKMIHRTAESLDLKVTNTNNRLEMAAWLSNRSELAWLENIIKEVNGVDEVPDWPASQHGYDEVAKFNQAVRKNGFNVPTAIYGVVKSGFFHGPDEHVDISDLKQQEELLTRVLVDNRFSRATYSLA